MESSFRKLVSLTKNVLNESDDFDSSKHQQCLRILKTLETIVEAENNCELDHFKNPTKKKNRTMSKKIMEDKMMALLHETSLISPSEFATYLVQEAGDSEGIDHNEEDNKMQKERLSGEMKRLKKIYS